MIEKYREALLKTVQELNNRLLKVERRVERLEESCQSVPFTLLYNEDFRKIFDIGLKEWGKKQLDSSREVLNPTDSECKVTVLDDDWSSSDKFFIGTKMPKQK